VSELTSQLGGQPVTHLVVATGSLGSMAGLIVGTWASGLDCQVHGHTVLWPQAQAKTRLEGLLEATRRQGTHSAIRQPSQYASTRGRRLPRRPISSTSGSLPAGARNQMSSPSAGARLKPDMPCGGSVAACMYAGVPWQHIRGRAAQTHSRPPRARTKSAASGLTSTLTITR